MTPPPAAAFAPPAPATRRSAPPRPPSARPPRRVSGPARPVARAGSIAAPRAGAIGLPRPAPATHPIGALDGPDRGLAHAAAAALGWFLGHPLLDRLLRGRLWIAIVSFALIGIVAMQLYVLKLNSGIGRAIEHEALLQRGNAALSIENSGLASGSRVESQATAMGMGQLAPGAVQFLSSHRSRDLREAVRALQTGGPAHAASTSAAAGESAAEEAPASSEAEVPPAEAVSGEAAGTEAGTGEAAVGEAGTGEAAPGEAGTAEAETTEAGAVAPAPSEAGAAGGEAPASAASTGGVQG